VRDVAYKILSVRKAYRYESTRRAVLTPLLGPGWHRHGVAGALVRLRLLWREKLEELRDADWPPALDELNFHYMRNCPPFGVHSAQMGLRCCRHRSLCPFCYARDRVLAPFMHMETAAYGGTDPSDRENGGWKKMPPGWRLVEFCHARVFTVRDGGPAWLPDYVRTGVCRSVMALARQPGWRRREFDMLRGLAGVVLYRVEPGKGRLTLLKSGLVFTRGGIPDGFEPRGGRFRFREHAEPSKKTLCAAAGRSFSYPTGLMTLPAGDAVAADLGMAGLRFVARYGPHAARHRR
jgi:hypothetical protein